MILIVCASALAALVAAVKYLERQNQREMYAKALKILGRKS